MKARRFHGIPRHGIGVNAILISLIGLFVLALIPRAGMATGAPFNSTLPPHLNRVPHRPPVRNLSHIKFPDLAVKSISWKPVGKSDPAKAVVTITLKNVGAAPSKATTVSGVLIREKGRRDKKSFRLSPLKPGARATVTWKVQWGVGKNTLVATVNDPINSKNNTLRKSFRYVPNVKKAMLPKKGLTHPIKIPDLAVTKITFDDLRLKRTGRCVARIEVKNVGTAPSRATTALITLAGGKGPRRRFSLKVRPIRPHRTLVLEKSFRPLPGKNLLSVALKDNINPKNNYLKKSYFLSGKGMTLALRHLDLSKKTLKGIEGKQEQEGRLSANAVKQLQDTRHARLSPPKGSTSRPTLRMGELGLVILSPRNGDAIALGHPCQIQWGIQEQPPDTHFQIVLDAVQTSQPVPELVIARDLPFNARAFEWNVNPNLPAGTYKLTIYASNGLSLTLKSVTLQLESLKFNFATRTVIEPVQPKIGRNVTVTAVFGTNVPCSQGTTIVDVTIEGPMGFRLKRRESFELPRDREEKIVLKVTFAPPFVGDYSVIFDPDATHRYPHSADALRSKRFSLFSIFPSPDLLVSVDKVSDGILNEDKTITIYVKNVGDAPSDSTEVVFRLTGARERHIPIPSLQPGEESIHSVKGHWKEKTGIKTYWAKVDPDDRIRESDESNNEIYDTFRIYADRASMPAQRRETPPKLEVETVYGLEDEMYAGKIYVLTVRLKNVSPDRQIISGTAIRIDGPTVLNRPILHNVFCAFNLYPGEQHDVAFTARWDSPGPARFRVRQRVHVDHGTGFVNELFSKELTVLENPEIAQGTAEVVMKQQPVVTAGQGEAKSLTILRPNRDIFWIKGHAVQIAWMGEAQPPFTVTLFPDHHPDQAVTIGTDLFQGSMNYEVANSLHNGHYRIRVQGSDGGGTSDIFEIRGESEKPDLKIKAGSIHSGYSGDPSKPYLVIIQAIIENRGGIQTRPFKVLFTVDDASHFIEVGPLMKQKTCFVEAALKVDSVGPHEVQIVIDPVNDVDESEEGNNVFRNPGYRCRGLPDLALVCRQKGNRMFFYVKNVGTGPSPETQCVLFYDNSAFPVRIPQILPGDVVTETMELFPATPGYNDPFSALVNPGRGFPELSYANNGWEGKLVQPYDTMTDETYFGLWKSHIRVEDKTPPIAHPVILLNGHPVNSPPHVRFEFILSNHSKHYLTPPVQAVLEIRQGENLITRVYQVPELLPEDDEGHRDTYHILYNAPLSINDGGILYTLTLRRGSEERGGARGRVFAPDLSSF